MTTALPRRPTSRVVGLALVAGLHAAVVGLLLADASRLPAAAPARAFLLVPLRAAVPTLPPTPAAPIAQRPRAPRPVFVPAPPVSLPPPVTATAFIEPEPEAPPAPAAPDPFAVPAGPAAPSLAERARSSAGKIARELAQEPSATAEAGALAGRRKQHFDRAWRGGSHGFTMDRYVSPDGTSVTRRTSRRGVSCYMPAPFQPSAIARSSERQQEVNCPPDDGRWQRH